MPVVDQLHAAVADRASVEDLLPLGIGFAIWVRESTQCHMFVTRRSNNVNPRVKTRLDRASVEK